MKNVILVLGLFVAGAAHAVPGSFRITCDSLKGAKQKVHIEAVAADVSGKASGFPSMAEIVFNGKVFQDKNDDGTLEDLQLTRHVTDHVIDAKYSSDNFYFEVWSLPDTVRLSKGTNDLEGRATFRAHALGYAQGQDEMPTTVNCVLDYNSGSAG